MIGRQSTVSADHLCTFNQQSRYIDIQYDLGIYHQLHLVLRLTKLDPITIT